MADAVRQCKRPGWNIYFPRLAPPWMLRNNDFCAALVQVGDYCVGIKSLAGDQSIEGHAFDQRRHTNGVVALSGQEIEANLIAQSVGPGRGFWLSFHLSICRSPGQKSPFCALSMTVDPDNCRIHHHMLHVQII